MLQDREEQGIRNSKAELSTKWSTTAYRGRVLNVNTLLGQEAENKKQRAEAINHTLIEDWTSIRLLWIISLPLGQNLINLFFLHILHPLKISEKKNSLLRCLFPFQKKFN